MFYQSTYKAANQVASLMEQHFSKHLHEAQLNGETNLADIPNKTIIEAIIDVAFWTSLRREEGHSPKISFAFLSPLQSKDALIFSHKLPLNADAITKIAPGVERAGIHVGIWVEDGELHIWGTTTFIPNLCFVLDVSEPGLLVVKHKRINSLGKYSNVAVLKGDEIRVIDEEFGKSTKRPAIINSLIGIGSIKVDWNDTTNILIQIAVSMRAHKRGGILLVVPTDNDDWMKSLIQPLTYTIQPVYKGLSSLAKTELNSNNEMYLLGQLKKEIENVAGLTAIDGATIINQDLEVLAFGAKIGRAEGKKRVNEISISEPIINGETIVVQPSQLGGTRHLSSAQFVSDQHQAMAMVASQDDHFTILKYSPKKEMVKAYRIDTLLL